MALNICSFVFVAAFCLPVTAAMAQAQQPSQQRDDPASVGTGPSSKAPGERTTRRRSARRTTNDRGVTMPADAPTPGDSKNPGSEQRERSDAGKNSRCQQVAHHWAAAGASCVSLVTFEQKNLGANRSHLGLMFRADNAGI